MRIWKLLQSVHRITRRTSVLTVDAYLEVAAVRAQNHISHLRLQPAKIRGRNGHLVPYGRNMNILSMYAQTRVKYLISQNERAHVCEL